jgi:glutamyl-tRNA synthetase
MASLRWVGIEWDEGPDIGGPYGPYIQSLRFDQGIYQVYSEQLLESGHAYLSFTTEEELARLRADAEMRGIKAFRFRGPERDWPLERQRELAVTGKPYTIRLKTPLTGQTTFTDLVRGAEGITVQNDQLQDIVLIKTSGMPVYHFAHLVDDHLMRITHVLRAEEWVPSTPYHVLLYQAFGWAPPVFAHLPVILRQDGKGKLSKRKDDVATNRFWERGYLPEAMLNYLALQGWSYDDKTEIMSREELIERFTIDRVQASPARWNPEKLRDMNGIYIRKLAPEDLAERLLPFLTAAGLVGDPPSEAERAYVVRLVPLIHERLEELSEAPGLLEFFFREPRPGTDGYPPATLIPRGLDAAQTAAMLQAAYATLRDLEPWTPEGLEAALRDLCARLERKPGQLFGALRVAVSGRTVAPPLFDMLAALGRERVLARLDAAVAALT